MSTYPHAQIVNNVFSLSEIDEITKYFDSAPVAHHFKPQNTNNKNLDYEIPGSFVNSLIRPKISKILNDPDHKFFGGAYKEYTIPYPLHVDNVIPTANMTFKQTTTHQSALLIPLMEGPGLKTAIFDVFMPPGQHVFSNGQGTVEDKVRQLKEFLQQEKTELDVEEFDHIAEPIKSMLPYLPLDGIYEWKLGSVIVWHFDQLHCSTNFIKHNSSKKFIVAFIN